MSITAIDNLQSLNYISVGGPIEAGNLEISPTGFLTTSSFDLSGNGITFGGSAGVSGDFLASQGTGVCPIWSTFPTNPLIMYKVTVTASLGAAQVWADVGEARTFTVIPIIALTSVDASGSVIPITLTSASTTGFTWASSSNLTAFNLSVYSLG